VPTKIGIDSRSANRPLPNNQGKYCASARQYAAGKPITSANSIAQSTIPVWPENSEQDSLSTGRVVHDSIAIAWRIEGRYGPTVGGSEPNPVTVSATLDCRLARCCWRGDRLGRRILAARAQYFLIIRYWAVRDRLFDAYLLVGNCC